MVVSTSQGSSLADSNGRATGRARQEKRRALQADLLSPEASRPSGPLRLLFTLSILLPLIVFGLASWSSRETVMRRAQETAIQTVALLHEHAQKVFETHELALRLLDEHIRGLHREQIEHSAELFDFLKQLDARFVQIGSLWVIGPSGKPWSSSLAFPVPDLDLSDRPYFQELRAGAELTVSEVYFSGPTDLPFFGLALRRSSPSGEFDGVLLATVSVQYFEDFYSAIGTGINRTISLMRSDGHELVRNPMLSDPVQFSPQSAVMRAIAGSDEGIYNAVGESDGIKRLFAYKKLDHYPVFVTFGLSKSAALSAWYEDVIQFGVFALVASLALLSITWLAYRRVQTQEALQRRLVEAKAGLEQTMQDRTAALAASEQRLRLATDAAELGAFEWHMADDRTVWENTRMYEIFDRKPSDGPIGRAEFFSRVVHPADVASLRKALSDGVSSGHVHATCRIRRHDGAVRWIELLGRFEYAPDGYPSRLIGMIADITERKVGEEHLKLLMAELNHRVKNTLASVQSMAFQTGRNATSMEEFREAYWARLGALARAHDVLTRRAWEGALLSDVATETLMPYGLGERISIDGPTVTLAPNAAVTVSMVLHELATNAVKYGALSIADGVVRLEWVIDRASETPSVVITWREENGPPVTPPRRTGFGSRLIKQAPAHELDAVVTLEYLPMGVCCTIHLPLSSRVAMGEAIAAVAASERLT